MHRLLHIGPGTCGIVSKLLKESNSEVWGIQPFRMKPPVHEICQSFVRKGLIRVAEVNQPLPYRSRSFSFVLVTDTLDIMKKRDLNATLPELSRLSAHNLVVVVGKVLNPKCVLTSYVVIVSASCYCFRIPNVSVSLILHRRGLVVNLRSEAPLQGWIVFKACRLFLTLTFAGKRRPAMAEKKETTGQPLKLVSG